MNEELKTFEKSIKKDHRFAFTPKYENEIHTQLSETTFAPIVIKVFDQLDWQWTQVSCTHLEAQRIGKGKSFTEKITVKYQLEKIIIQSKSLGGGIWDNGHNSQRVKLFIYAFDQLQERFSNEDLNELEEKIKKKQSWADYEIPRQLPPPPEQTKPLIAIPIIGGFLLALVLGYSLAALSFQGAYYIVLFDVIIGLIVGFSFNQFIKISNYNNIAGLFLITAVVVLIIYTANQYFLYQFMYQEVNMAEFTFFEFIKARFRQGLVFESFNLGWIGLIVGWIFQLAIAFFTAQGISLMYAIQHFTKDIPTPVLDFALHHTIKNKSEQQIRTELTKMGWSKEHQQNAVFQGLPFRAQELNVILPNIKTIASLSSK